MHRTVPLILLLAAPEAFAKVTKVSITDNLKTAISDASAGDTLLLDAGTYSTCPLVNAKALTIVGQGASETVIDCGGSSSSGFEVRNASGVVIHALSVKNAAKLPIKVSGSSASFYGIEVNDATSSSGGAMRISSSTVTIAASSFDGNRSSDVGGSIYATSSTLYVYDTSITNSTATDYGGALYAENTTAYIVGLNASGNTADYGGAVFVTSTSGTYYPTITDSSLTDNTASTDGGAIYLSGAIYGTIKQSTLSGNAATVNGGAIYADYSTNVYDCALDTNSAAYGGGYYGQTLTSYRSTWSENSATYGGAAYVPAASAGDLRLRSTADIFDSNVATSDGGAVWWSGNYGEVRDSLFRDNAASTGGAILHSGGYLTLTTSDFTSNTATGTDASGGAIATSKKIDIYGTEFSSNTASANGGAVFANSSSPQVYIAGASSIHGNSAQSGGGIAVTAPSTASTGLGVYQTSMYENTATNEGGAVMVRNTYAYISESWLYTNSGGSGGAVALLAPYYWTLQQSLLCDNEATTGSGGALYVKNKVYGGGNTWLAFVENHASSYGGAVFEDGYSSSSDSAYQASIYVGNYSTGATYYDNHVGANGVRLFMYDNVYQGNGRTALSGVGSTKPHFFYGSLFYDHATTIYNDNSYLSASYKNYAVDPKITSWSKDGDCFNDTLTLASSITSAYTGQYGYGVGLQSTLGGTSPVPTTDNDGDGMSLIQGDCDDNDATVYRGAPRVDFDSGTYTGYRDEDCVGQYDYDNDGDGYAAVGAGYSDCDDSNDAVYPGAPDSDDAGTDYDCDGFSNDADHDGYAPTRLGGTDCDDTNIAVYPGAPDAYYDGVDANCDGYDADVDGDGYEYPSADCDDADATSYVGAAEIWYDGVDGDCGGDDDYDADADGERPPDHGGMDCDDDDPLRSSLFEDVWYDGVDSDCQRDDDFDQDRDGQRSADDFTGGTDCDDTDPLIYEGAPERLNGLDDDCDGAPEADSDDDGVYDPTEDQFNGEDGRTLSDSDGDGMWDGVEWGDDLEGPPVDSDGDRIADVRDTDSDNDGVEDRLEHTDQYGNAVNALVDSDGDGVADSRDTDDDNDGVPTIAEGADDADGDGLPNRLDGDADGDGAADASEGTIDGDNDGVPNFLDNGATAGPEGDGDPTKFGFGCSTSGAPLGGLAALLPALLLVRRRRC
jgi:predicted outer membrane repeat protein